MEGCTFQPKINKKVKSYFKSMDYDNSSLQDTSSSTVNGFEKTIGRMRHAHAETVKKKVLLEYINTGENYEKMKNEEFKFNPPSMMVSREKK